MAASDVLSQSEIDQLLSALSTGVVSAEEIKDEEIQNRRQRKEGNVVRKGTQDHLGRDEGGED